MVPDPDRLFLFRLELTPAYHNPANWSGETQAVIEAHFNWLQAQGRAGRLLMAGRTSYEPGDERLFGLVIVRAGDEEEAAAMMRQDPALVAGVMGGQAFDFSTAVGFPENHPAAHD